MKNQFPASDGWLRMKLTMTSNKPRSEDELKRIASFGKPENYEWGTVTQYGSRVNIICREKSQVLPTPQKGTHASPPKEENTRSD